jgi:hypothetical protein
MRQPIAALLTRTGRLDHCRSLKKVIVEAAKFACGGSSCKGRGISQGLERSAAREESPLVCTNGAQRSAEDWGYPCGRERAEPLGKGF